MWVPAAAGAVDVGCVLCPRLSGGEKALLVWQQRGWHHEG